MRAMGTADRDQGAQSRRMQRRELQADHRAIGTADECVDAVDVERIEHRRDRIGLVGRIDRCIERAIGAKPVDGEDATVPRIEHASGANLALPPTRFRESLGGGDMATGGNAAGDQHHRRMGRADQFVADLQAKRAGVAQDEVEADHAAHAVGMRCCVHGRQSVDGVTVR